MAVHKRNPRIRLRRWPTEDWYYTNGLYRFIKGTFQRPVSWAAGLQVKGRENVPLDGPLLLAANHFSWADPIVVGAALPRPAFYLAKERLFHNSTVAWLLEGMGQIKVDRVHRANEGSLTHAVECLQQGLVIGVFPEGTRSRYGELKRGKTGIARIAAWSGAPVLPIALTTAEFWPKHAPVPNFREKVYVNIGTPMRLDLKPGDAEDRQKMRDATDDVMERIGALLAEAQDAKRRGETWT